MKKEDIASLFVYLVLIAAAIITGSVALKDAFGYYHLAFSPQIFAILGIIVAFLLNAIGLEAFHALGAKLGGYEVVSINVLGFCFEKQECKWKFRFGNFEGFSGETLVNKKKDKASIKPFIWLPLIAYVIEFSVCLLLCSLAEDSFNKDQSIGWLAPLTIIFIIISSMIALYNIVPLKLDTITDGYRLLLISKPENVEAFDERMRIENLARNGKKIENAKTFQTINNFTANVNLYAVFEEIFKGNYENAEKICDLILSNEDKIDEETNYKALSQKIYCLLEQEKLEEAKKLYEMKKRDKFRRFIANDTAIETLRSYLLIAALIEESESEVIYVNEKKTKYLNKAFKTRAEEEKQLFEKDLKKIYKLHPDWEKK